MAGRPQVTNQDAVGVSAGPSADIPKRLAIIAAAEAGPLTSTLRTGRAEVLAAHTAGPLVRSALHILAGTNLPVITQRCAASNTGEYDTIDVASVFGTCEPAVNAAYVPRDENECYWVVKDGGTLGSAGITYYDSLDNGRTLSGLKKLGTSTILEFSTEGIRVDLNPPTDALVLLATDLQTQLLAHFADATAHNSADTASAALITLSTPTDNDEAIDVINECRLALIAHLGNVTAHDSYDVASLVATTAADTQQGARALLNILAPAYELHRIVTFAAAPASLKAATATVASPVTVLRAALLTAGLARLAAYPSKLTFTTAGATPSDAPASVTIVGLDQDGAAQTESALALAQTASSVSTTKYWSDITSIAYPSADGTAATIAVGIASSVHNSADSTNVITEDPAEPGTLLAGDVIRVQTFAPYPSVDDLADAFTALVKSGLTPGIVLLPGRTPASYAPTITAGLDLMDAQGKPVGCMVQMRRAAGVETQTDLRNACETEIDAQPSDKRILWCATDALCTLTEGTATRSVARTRFTGFTNNLAVERLLVPFYETTWQVGRGGLNGVSLRDGGSVLVGHNEPQDIDTRLQLLYEVPSAPLGRPTVASIDYCFAGAEDREKTLRVNLIRDEIERNMNAFSWGLVGLIEDVTLATPTIGTLDSTRVKDLQRNAAALLEANPGLAAGISDIDAPDLVVLSPNVTVDGDIIYLEFLVNWTPRGAIGRVDTTISTRTGGA